MEIPQAPDFKVEIDMETLYSALYELQDKEAHKMMLYKIYEKATQLETKRNELEGKISKQQEENRKLGREIEEWQSGERNFLKDCFNKGKRDDILDVFFIMIQEHNIEEVNERKLAHDRLKTRLDMHEYGTKTIVNFMADLLEVVMDKLVPDDDFVYLVTGRLSNEEKSKLERVIMSETDERIAIGDQAIALNPADLHLQNNQVLIDPKKMDTRERQTLMKALDPGEESDASVALPARAFVQSGRDVKEENIKRVPAFPEENPDTDVEEVDQEIYGEDVDSTGSEGEPNDGLPFD